MRLYRCNSCCVLYLIAKIDSRNMECGIVHESFDNTPGSTNPREQCRGDIVPVDADTFLIALAHS